MKNKKKKRLKNSKRDRMRSSQPQNQLQDLRMTWAVRGSQ